MPHFKSNPHLKGPPKAHVTGLYPLFLLAYIVREVDRLLRVDCQDSTFASAYYEELMSLCYRDIMSQSKTSTQSTCSAMASFIVAP